MSKEFQVVSPFEPSGDQPEAIKQFTSDSTTCKFLSSISQISITLQVRSEILQIPPPPNMTKENKNHIIKRELEA